MRIHLLAVIIALAIAVPAAAEEGCELTGPTPDVSSPTGHYVDASFCQPDCLVSLVVYEESNGVEGLQRQDRAVDDTCGGKAGEGDTLILGVFL